MWYVIPLDHNAVGACMVAVLLTFYEFFKGAKEQSDELGTTWFHEIKHSWAFAMQCYGNTKVIVRCLEEGDNVYLYTMKYECYVNM